MTLDRVFLQILNMSITGSYVILAILLVRLVLKKAPKIFSYVLWSVAAFRLLSPVSFPSIMSLFSLKPFTMTAAQTGAGPALVYVPSTVGQMQTPNITTGIESVDRIINEGLPMANATASANPMQIWTAVAAGVWVAGFLVLLIYGIVSYAKVRRLVSHAVRIEGNVFEADHIPTPFVLGFLKPRIFLPFHMPESERAYILRHERHHIRRGDHFIKPLSYLLLTVHWFNPLVWVAFHLMVQDMEMSCDELVLRQMGLALKRDYSESLLSLATRQRFPIASPLAFGESNTRLRVRNVLNFRRPRTWIMIVSLLLSLVVLLACATNPAVSGSDVLQSGFKDGLLSLTSSSLSSVDIQMLGKYDTKLASNDYVIQIKKQGYMDQFLARLESEFNRKMNIDLADKINQIQQWGMNPQIHVRDLESMAIAHLDSVVNGMPIGSPAFDQYVASSLSDGPSGIAGLAKTDASIGPTYLFMCIYQDYNESQAAAFGKYPFADEFYNKSLEELFREDISRDFASTDCLNILNSFVREMNLDKNVSSPLTQTASSGFGNDQAIIRTYLEQYRLAIVPNSMACLVFQLPGDFNATINGKQVGKILQKGNEYSRTKGLDFSDYLGQKAHLWTAEVAEGKSSQSFDILILISGSKIIGYWQDQGENDPLQNESDFKALLSLESTSGLTSETRIATDLITDLLNIPNEQIRLAIGSPDPANPSAADEGSDYQAIWDRYAPR